MTKQPTIAPNLRMLHVLEAFRHSNAPMTATQINKHIGLPKQTIHRLIKIMVQDNFLKYDEGTKLLRPSRRTRDIGLALMQQSYWPIIRHQILQQLASITGETINFVIPGDKGMQYIDRVETSWSFKVQLPIGSHVPFHATASGKVFLANLPPKKREIFMRTMALPALTHNSISDHQTLEHELCNIKKQHYAIDNEEFIDNMMAIAVPIYDAANIYMGSLAIHGPKQRIILRDNQYYIDLLHHHAAKLTDALGVNDE